MNVHRHSWTIKKVILDLKYLKFFCNSYKNGWLYRCIKFKLNSLNVVFLTFECVLDCFKFCFGFVSGDLYKNQASIVDLAKNFTLHLTTISYLLFDHNLSQINKKVREFSKIYYAYKRLYRKIQKLKKKDVFNMVTMKMRLKNYEF